MNHIKSIQDFESLFKLPFEPQTLIYSINSDFFREGNSLCKTGSQQFAVDLDDDLMPYSSLPEFPCGERGCRALFSSVREYDIHFKSVHCLVCSECKRSFPTYNMLDIHIQEKHDSYHEAEKARNIAVFKCFVEGCSFTFHSSAERDAHVTHNHNFPLNFKYQNLKKIAEEKTEQMDVSEQNELHKDNSGHKRKPQVPKQICFGRGSARTFKSCKKNSNREITMKELADAL